MGITVLDKDGNVVDTWTSDAKEAHVIKRLVVGETYTLREEFAPYGYLKATDIQFTVEDTGKVQHVEMKDEVPTGSISCRSSQSNDSYLLLSGGFCGEGEFISEEALNDIA